MTAIEIMEQVKAVEQVEAGKAMYYTPHEDRVIIGNDGCQPSNTICLRVGPDHISNIDLGEIYEEARERCAEFNANLTSAQIRRGTKLEFTAEG